MLILKNLDHLCVSGIFDFDADLADMFRESRPSCTIEAYHCKYSMTVDELFRKQVIHSFPFHLIQNNAGNDNEAFNNNSNNGIISN